jgi:hypothetical protein
MISIGAHFNGPELDGSKIDQSLSRAMKAVELARGPGYEQHTAPAVNVVFYVPGSLGSEGPTKIEAARFSRKQKLLLVAVPVPPEIVESDGAAEFVIDALHQADQIAAETFARKGTEPFDLEQAEAIVEKVRQSLLDHGY